MTYDEKTDAKAMTSYYLFGQATPPKGNELLDDKWINRGEPADLVFSNSEFHEYMTTGPGQFANASQISLVENFFSFDVTPDLLGKKFTLSQALATFGGSIEQELYQSDYKDGGGQEWAERVYLFETQKYQLNQNIEFYINGDGIKSIKNFALMLKQEDFDFTGSIWSNLGNAIIEPNIDPSSIGQTVILKYPASIGSGYHEQYGTTYTIDDFRNDEIRYSDQNHGTLAEVYFPIMDLIKELWDNGTTQFIDPQGRAIVYGTTIGDTIDLSPNFLNLPTNPFPKSSKMYEFYDDNFHRGIAIVTGDGNDFLSGGNFNDYLDGGKGADNLQGGKGDDRLVGGYDDKDDGVFDALYGGEGFDTYIAGNSDIIMDEDGEGEVYFDETLLTGGKKEAGSGCEPTEDDGSSVYKGNGGTYTLSGDTLTFERGGETLTILNLNDKRMVA